jgi:hypothetical protein
MKFAANGSCALRRSASAHVAIACSRAPACQKLRRVPGAREQESPRGPRASAERAAAVSANFLARRISRDRRLEEATQPQQAAKATLSFPPTLMLGLLHH